MDGMCPTESRPLIESVASWRGPSGKLCGMSSHSCVGHGHCAQALMLHISQHQSLCTYRVTSSWCLIVISPLHVLENHCRQVLRLISPRRATVCPVPPSRHRCQL